MKAIRIHGRGGPNYLDYEEAPQPLPGPEAVLVRVAALDTIYRKKPRRPFVQAIVDVDGY